MLIKTYIKQCHRQDRSEYCSISKCTTPFSKFVHYLVCTDTTCENLEHIEVNMFS